MAKKNITKSPNSKELIVVNGVLIQSTLPSKALLEKRFDEIYKDVRVGDKFVSLVRGWFLNRLSVLARKYYCEILPRYAVRIADGLYLVPMEKLVNLEREIDDLRRLYEDYEKKLKDFFYHGEIPDDVRRNAKFYEGYKDIVLEYIRRVSKDKNVKIELPSIVDRVKINLFPLRIDPTLWKNYVDEELQRREQELIRKLEEDLERARREAIQTAQADIKKRLLELNRTIIKALNQLKGKKRVSKATRDKISRMLEDLRSSNLFDDPEIDGLIKAYEGLAESIAKGSEEEQLTGETVVIEEIGKAASIEKPREEEKEKVGEKMAGYVEVFKDFADTIGSRLKAEESMIDELKEVDKKFVEALGKLSEAISS